ncbi:MAG: hypothetical protein ABR505_10645 [Actinomycetota bacterium]
MSGQVPIRDDTKRCSVCGASNDASAEWCGQCHTKFPGVRPVDYQTAVKRALSAGAAAERAQKEKSATSADLVGSKGLLPKLGISAQMGLLPVDAAQDGSFSMAFKVEKGALTWSCSTCGNENPIRDHVCSICNTPFKKAARHYADKDVRRRHARSVFDTAGALAAFSPLGWATLPLRLLFLALSALGRMVFRPRR